METELKIELKYCERCGGLFFRRADATHVYCFPCEPEMRKVAVPSGKRISSEHWNRVVQAARGVTCA